MNAPRNPVAASGLRVVRPALTAALLLALPGGASMARQVPADEPSADSPSAVQEPAQAHVLAPARDSLRTGPTDPAELEAFLDGVMKIQLQDHHAAGAVVTVVKDGAVFLAKGYGYADWEGRKKVDAETTLFRIGSVTKLFVWTSVMQLAEEGKLDLDADVNQYLVDFQIPATYQQPITLRDIMSHSAGFEDYVIRLFGNDSTDLAPLGEILAQQLPVRVRPPGEVSSYSNHAAGIAAYIVEQVSGTAWDEYVQESILDPLGMEHFSVEQPLPEELAGDMSKGYTYGGGQYREKDFEFVPLYPVGAGAASGTAMAKFMIAHLQDGRYGDARILQEETARQMHSALFRMAPGMNAMDYGFYELSSNGEHVIGHGGDTRWFHSELALFPERGLGVFVSYNSQGGGAATGQFMNAFVDHYFPREAAVPTPPEDFADRAHRFTGRFRSNRFSHTTLAKIAALENVKVRATKDGTLKAMNAEWVEVAPLTFSEKYGDRRLIFREGDDGRITHFFVANAPVVAFERVPWTEGTLLHALLGIFAAIMIVGTVAAWPLGWSLRRWYGVKGSEMDRIGWFPRWTLRLAALFFLAFLVGLGITLADPMAIAAEVPASLRPTLFLPMVGAAFTVGALVSAIFLVLKERGRKTVRVVYALTTISFVTFLWQLQVWNLLGWEM